MKKTLILSSFIAISLATFAAPRSEQVASEIAFSHFCNSAGRRAKVNAKNPSRNELSLVGTATSILGMNAGSKARVKGSAAEPFYVYNNGNVGFVIVSGDDAIEPILAYSDEGAFEVEGMPEQLRAWLQMYADEMDYAATSQKKTFEMSEAAPRKASAYPSVVAPLLQYNGEMIQWDQNTPFNKECPTYSGYLCPVGCVATAFGQIMYYHRWPEKGQGGTKNYISYPHSFSQSFNFSEATFDFNKMLPHYYFGKYTDEQGAEVAKLSHAIGVAAEMQYDPQGSGAYSIFCGDAIVKYFNYDKNLHYAYRDYFTQEEWIDMIKKEISEGRPICYAGSSTSVGHQFVFDGYDAENRVHVNWGWAGMSDGYFSLSVLAPSSTGTGGGSVTSGGFIYNQAMWLGMQKPTETSVPQSFMTINSYSANMDGYSDTFLQIDKTNVMLGEKITLSTTEIANLSTVFNGFIGTVIEDAKGNQISLCSSAKKSMKCGSYSRDKDVVNQECVIPTDLADGEYTIYLASKAEGEPRWSRIRAAEGYCDHYDMTVQDGKVVFNYYGEINANGTLVADHTIYTKCRSSFTAKIKNENKREYFGIAHVGIYKENEDGSPNLIAICGKEQITLPYDKEVEITFRGAIEAASSSVTVNAGNYKACVIVENQGKYYQVSDDIDITVKRIPSGMASLQCDDFTPTQNSYGIDENIEGHIKVTNMQSVYSNFLGIIVFKEKSTSGAAYWEKEVFLEKGISAEYSFSIPAQFEPGTYRASLRYTGGAEYSNEISTFTFEVRDEYVSILDVKKDAENASTGGHTDYFTISGQKLSSEPSRGIYLIRQRKADGTQTVKKINK